MRLIKFPLPPSINKQLTLSRGRFIKTNAARLFDAKVQQYKLIRFKEIISLYSEKNYKRG